MNNAVDPRSPLELDRERVTCLLLINTQLMKKGINIYHNILSNQQTLQQLPPQARQTVVESYQNCTRRIHCNLSVLSHIHEKYHTDLATQQASQNKTTFPIMMTAPQDMPELNQLYTKLQELYPEAFQLLKSKINQMRKQQALQAQGQNQPVPGQQLQSPALSQSHSSAIPSSQHSIPPQSRQLSGHGQIRSPMVNTPGKDSNNQFDYLPQQIPNGGINPQSASFTPSLSNISQQPHGSAISPQQILQQINGGGNDVGSGSNGMLDFFNA